MIYYINQNPIGTELFDSTSVFKQNSNFYNFNTNKGNLFLEPAGSFPIDVPNSEFFVDQDLFCSVSQQLPDNLNLELEDDPVVEVSIEELLEL